MNNFNIFIDKLYLKTDGNVWFTNCWPPQTWLKFWFKQIEKIYLMESNQFCSKIFGIFHTNEMRNKIKNFRLIFAGASYPVTD